MSQKEFWMSELYSFLKNPAKKEMLVENGEFSVRGNAYGSKGIRVGEEIVTSPVRYLKKVTHGKRILVKTGAGCIYCIRGDGYNHSPDATFNAFAIELSKKI